MRKAVHKNVLSVHKIVFNVFLYTPKAFSCTEMGSSKKVRGAFGMLFVYHFWPSVTNGRTLPPLAGPLLPRVLKRQLWESRVDGRTANSADPKPARGL